MRIVNVVSAATAGLSAYVLLAPRAIAEEHTTHVVQVDMAYWADHPGAGVAAAAGVAVLALAIVVGAGCALSVLGAMWPSLRGAMDRHARASSPAWATLVGVLVGLGVAAAGFGAHHSGSHVVAGFALLLLVIPAMLLGLAGAIATVPLLGERVLGRRGAEASPLRLACTGCVVLALALLAAATVHPVLILLLAVTFGWPLGVAVGAVVGRVRGRSAPAAGSPPSEA